MYVPYHIIHAEGMMHMTVYHTRFLYTRSISCIAFKALLNRVLVFVSLAIGDLSAQLEDLGVACECACLGGVPVLRAWGT